MNLSREIDSFAKMRLRMVEDQLRARGIRDERVLEAMARVPRHEFVPPRYRDQAYEDHPLPIGEEQTISQPYIVALMLEDLTLSSKDNALEIGTGSGYVTALLAQLTAQVISIERHAALAYAAAGLLGRLGYNNARVVVGDGSLGFPASAPCDAILVSAAAADVPQALVAQLAEGGRMMIPVGREETQQLQLIRMKNGALEISPREFCRFVPLVTERAL